MNTGDFLFTGVAFIGFFIWLIPILFILWFMLTTVKQLKKQTVLLENISARLDVSTPKTISSEEHVSLAKRNEPIE